MGVYKEGRGERNERGYLEVDIFGFGVSVNLAHDISSTGDVFFVQEDAGCGVCVCVCEMIGVEKWVDELTRFR